MKVAILDDYQKVALKIADWKSLPADAKVTAFSDHLADADALVERLKSFDVVVAMRERTPFPRAVLERLPNLKLLVTTGPANASIDLKTATERGLPVCGTQASASDAAEIAWGLILALLRHIPQEDAATHQGHWQTTLGTRLQDKTLGILGLGKLGSRVAAVGSAFKMPIIAWSQNLTAEKAAQQNATLVTKDELFRRSDILSIHLVLSDRTRQLVTAREIGLMKPTAYIINTSRGPIIDEKALVEVLQARAIAGAGLDVFEQEPMSADNPLKRLDNVVITPHLGFVTNEAYRIYYADAIEDIKAYLLGQPVRLLNPNVIVRPKP